MEYIDIVGEREKEVKWKRIKEGRKFLLIIYLMLDVVLGIVRCYVIWLFCVVRVFLFYVEVSIMVSEDEFV